MAWNLEDSILDEIGGHKFIGHEGNGLTGHDSQKTGCNPLPECQNTFFLGNKDARLTQTSVL